MEQYYFGWLMKEFTIVIDHLGRQPDLNQVNGKQKMSCRIKNLSLELTINSAIRIILQEGFNRYFIDEIKLKFTKDNKKVNIQYTLEDTVKELIKVVEIKDY